MSKPIPLFAFAFMAYALTRPTEANRSEHPPRGRAQKTAMGGSHPETSAEADRFIVAWGLAPFDKRGFSVCVRASKVAKAPGFRLLTGEERRASRFEYVWLGDIEAKPNGFVGRAREPLGGIGGALSNQKIAFGVANIAHWAFASLESEEPNVQVERS